MFCFNVQCNERVRSVDGEDCDGGEEDDDSKLSQAELDKIAVSLERKTYLLKGDGSWRLLFGPMRGYFTYLVALWRAQCLRVLIG